MMQPDARVPADPVLRLRVHHLLCCPLFSGHGYSEAFAGNMTGVIGRLRKNCRVRLTDGPDEICAACPNLQKKGRPAGDGSCLLDRNNVTEKDRRLAAALALNLTEIRTASELFAVIRDRLTPEIFAASCHSCRWYREGLCNIKTLRKNAERFV
jgi:hypothetical protein